MRTINVGVAVGCLLTAGVDAAFAIGGYNPPVWAEVVEPGILGGAAGVNETRTLPFQKRTGPTSDPRCEPTKPECKK